VSVLDAADPEPLGVALLGSGFMARAHSKALLDIAMLGERRLRPSLISIAGRNEAALAGACKRFGWQRRAHDWREQIDDRAVGLFINTAPNSLHAEPTIAAATVGKHVLCEKPLAADRELAHSMWRAAEAAGVVHVCGFNLRFAPAARLAYEMIRAGEIGEVIHFRAQFLESSALDERDALTWRDRSREAGGAVGDLGSHIVDLARWLAGEPVTVQAQTQALIARRKEARVEVEDAFGALVHFASGASGVLEASRVAGGVGTRCAFEADGTQGSLRFSSERINELRHAGRDRAIRTVRVTGQTHPFMEMWWPHPGHEIGWGDTFTHQIGHVLDAIAGEHKIAPLGADFQDGYRCAEICAAVQRSAASRCVEQVAYRTLDAPELTSMSIERSE
jgi:predicted dehydrogenase